MPTPADRPFIERWAAVGGVALLLCITVGVSLTVPGAVPAEATSLEVASSIGIVPIAKCGECGVIESARETVATGNRGDSALPVEGHQDSRKTKRYETVVRMPDGSRHTVHDVNPPPWRTGERVILIAGRAR